jgi:hypothetical protein
VRYRAAFDACQVLDVTKFMLEHPGGKRVIMMSVNPAPLLS